MSDITGRRIALIGGTGFLCHNLALKLKRRGAEVSVVEGFAGQQPAISMTMRPAL